jgi:hypothetical protein
MKTLTILKTGNQLYDRIAGLLNGEAGEVTGSPYTDGKQFYCASFAGYGEVTWIPAECCTITETEDATA